MDRPTALRRAAPVLHWLKRSIDTHGGKGSAAWQHPLWGWSEPYPETTGYLLPTLLQWAEISGDGSLLERAKSCGDWLLDIRLPEGPFPGGVGTGGPPLVFDTGMVLFGLEAMARQPGGERFHDALRGTAHWLADGLGEDGRWHADLYTPGHAPAYHSQVVWALALAAEGLADEALMQAARQAYEAHRHFLDPSLPWVVRDAGIRHGAFAELHFLVYALEGLAECARLFEDDANLHRVGGVADHLVDRFRRTGRLPGALQDDGREDNSFRCLVGEAQLALLLTRLRGAERRATAEQILAGIPVNRVLWPLRGGIFGSWPPWGPYQRFRCINWGAKYWLDACAALIEEDPS